MYSKICLFIGFSSFFCNICSAQTIALQNDTTKASMTTTVLDTSEARLNLLNFYKKNKDWLGKAMPNNWVSSLENYNGLVAKAKDMKPKKVAKRQSSAIGLSYSFIDSDTTQFDEPLTIGNINIQHSATVAGIPLNITGNAIFINQKFDKKLSNINVKFDYQKHLETIKSKMIDVNHLGDNLQGKINNPLAMGDIELKAVAEEKLFEQYQYIVTHPKFAEKKKQIRLKLDSMEQYFFCRVEEFRDSTLKDSVWKQRLSLQPFEDIEHKFQKIWELKQKHEHILQEIETKAKGYQKELEQFENPNFLIKKALSNKKLSFMDKVKTLTKDFDIGQFNLEVSDYTCKFLLINGIRYHYDNQKIGIQVAYGKQSLLTPINRGLLGKSIFEPFDGRKFIFLGIDKRLRDSSLLTFNFLKADDNGLLTDSTVIYPKHNVVLESIYEKMLNKKFGIDVSMAVSRQEFDDIPLNNVLVKKGLPLAINAHLLCTPFSKNQVRLALGYFRVEPNFNTLGNPFLLRNREGLSSKLVY